MSHPDDDDEDCCATCWEDAEDCDCCVNCFYGVEGPCHCDNGNDANFEDLELN